MKELDKLIRIRVSAEDKAAFETEAKAAGLNVSAWARHHLKRVQPMFVLQPNHHVAKVGDVMEITPKPVEAWPLPLPRLPSSFLLEPGTRVTGTYSDGTPFEAVVVSTNNDEGEAK